MDLEARDGVLTHLPKPFAREMARDWQGAAVAWEQLRRPYDAALVWLSSEDEAGLRQALRTLDDMGAGQPPPWPGGG